MKVLDVAQESLRVLEALEVTSFIDFIASSVPLQTLRVFPDIAVFSHNSSAQNGRLELKKQVRRALDSLMIQYIDLLLLGEVISSFTGKLKVNDVMVSKDLCSFRRQPNEFGTMENVELDLQVLHRWLDSLFPSGPCRPALLDHLLSLLVSVPGNYDSSPEAKKAYPLSVRNHMWLASFARQQTLLINFGKLLKFLNPSDLAKLESALNTTGGNSHKWIEFVDKIKVMDDLRMRRETAKEKIRVNKKDNLLGLSHFLGVFEIHAHEHLLDSNHESVLKHFEEVHHIMQSFFEDDMADLYGVLLCAWDSPLVKSGCDCYEGRG